MLAILFLVLETCFNHFGYCDETEPGFNIQIEITFPTKPKNILIDANEINNSNSAYNTRTALRKINKGSSFPGINIRYFIQRFLIRNFICHS